MHFLWPTMKQGRDVLAPYCSVCVDGRLSMVLTTHPPVFVVSGSCWTRAGLWVSLSFSPMEEPYVGVGNQISLSPEFHMNYFRPICQAFSSGCELIRENTTPWFSLTSNPNLSNP